MHISAHTDILLLGAGLVGSYLYANPTDPIISGVIAMSGAATGGSPSPNNGPNSFSQLAKLVGCDNLDSQDELSCMQNVTALRLQDVVSSTSAPGSNISIPRFGAVVDNVTMFTNLTERLEKNMTARVVSIHSMDLHTLR